MSTADRAQSREARLGERGYSVAMLADLEVLVLDCQASGASPAQGALLEVGWGSTTPTEVRTAAHATWIVPEAGLRISKVVRQLTGWSEACIPHGIDATAAWQQLLRVVPAEGSRIPTVIHFARFERPFLLDLHQRAGGDADSFPLDIVCVHAIAERLFPELPRRNLRALAGHLGHSADLLRRAEGHVAATAAIWRALVPRLAELGLDTWEQLRAWLAEPAPRPARTKRKFPMPAAVRRALPEGPGVYRFLRPNGDVLYVGKATSLRARVASHFGAGARTTERALEMLSQAHGIDATETATVLEAALLETDEIKRLDPPYNVQLRGGERSAWFASLDWSKSAPAPDLEHPVGPLPSRYALRGLAALRQLLEGIETDDRLRAAAGDCAPHEAPSRESFEAVWHELVATTLPPHGTARARLLHAGDRLSAPESPPGAEPGWDEARIRRHLERTLVGGAALVRRARLLSLLAYAHIRVQESRLGTARLLCLRHGGLESVQDARDDEPEPQGPGPLPARSERLAAFDADRYDRMRILATELRRVVGQGGTVSVRAGTRARTFGERDAQPVASRARATSAKVSGESSSPR